MISHYEENIRNEDREDTETHELLTPIVNIPFPPKCYVKLNFYTGYRAMLTPGAITSMSPL